VIATETEEEALAAIERIDGGEEFADVAREVSTEADVETTGGVKEYAPEGSFNSAYDAFAFEAEVGELSEPLEGAGGSAYYVVRVTDRSDQPASEAHKTTFAREEFTGWVEEVRDEATSSGALVMNWEDEDQAEALVDVFNDQSGRLAAQQRQQQEQQQRAIEAQLTAAAAATQGPAATPAPEGTTVAGEDSPPAPDGVDDGADAPPVDDEAPSAGDDEQ
jgi:parvulin-like peptidyl-prolyl isomerase